MTEQNKMVRLHGDGAITYGMRFTTTLGIKYISSTNQLHKDRDLDLVSCNHDKNWIWTLKNLYSVEYVEECILFSLYDGSTSLSTRQTELHSRD